MINLEFIADCIAGNQMRGMHDMLAVDKHVITLYVRDDEAIPSSTTGVKPVADCP